MNKKMRGYFKDSRPYLDLEIYGVNPESTQKFTARIDTGFDGYLTMPLTQAFALGLVLSGMQDYTVADERVITNLVCLGNVKVEGKTVFTAIDLSNTGGIILIGNSLLRELGSVLKIDYKNEKIEISEK